MRLTIPLDPAEYWFWLIDQALAANTVMVARLRGTVAEERLRHALHDIQRRHPRLRVFIAGDGERPAFVSGAVPEIPLLLRPRHTDTEWCSVAEQEILLPLPTATGPLLRVTLLHDSQGADLLCTLHHAICDGVSAFYLLTDLLDVLHHPEREHPVYPWATAWHPDLQRVGTGREPPAADQWINAYLLKFLQSVQRTATSLPPPEAWPTRFCTWMLPVDATAQLVARCREAGTSVQGALSAAGLLALSRSHHSQAAVALTAVSAVNLRDPSHSPATTGLHLGASEVSTSHLVAPDQAFWSLAREIKQKLGQAVANGEAFRNYDRIGRILTAAHATPEDAHALMRQLSRGKLLVTNLGSLPLPPSTLSPRVEGFYGMVPALGEGLVLSAATVNGSLMSSFSYPVALVSPQDANAINAAIYDGIMYAITV